MFFRQRRERKRREAVQAAKEAERRLYWHEQVERALAGDEEARQLVVRECPYRRWAEVQKMRRDHEEQVKFNEVLNKYRHLLSKWHKASQGDAIDRLAEVLDFFRYRGYRYRGAPDTGYGNKAKLEQETGTKLEELKAELKRLVSDHYNSLVSELDARQSFLNLMNLIRRTRYPSGQGGDLRYLGVEPLAYPDDWNERVCQHLANPYRWDFVRLQEFSTGEMRLLAATALREDDPLKAKIVLAHCKPYTDREFRRSDAWKYWHSEVGDTLITELTKLVDRHNAQLGLSEQEAQEPEVQG